MKKKIQAGDMIYFTDDFPMLEVIDGPAEMGSGKISVKTANYWNERREDVYVISRKE